jgi:hypothetical protein
MDKVVIVPFFNDATTIEDQDPVAVFERTQAVSDDDRCAILAGDSQ